MNMFHKIVTCKSSRQNTREEERGSKEKFRTGLVGYQTANKLADHVRKVETAGYKTCSDKMGGISRETK